MRYRRLGKTLVVSEIGFGGWGIGGVTTGATSYGATDDRESVRTLQKAFDNGISYYDTAGVYGHSEELIGRTFKDCRGQVVIGTKVGFHDHLEPQDFTKENISASLEKSLKNMGTDYVDLYQLHNPDNPDITKTLNDDVVSTLLRLKEKGLTRALGVSVKSPQSGLVALGYGIFDSVQTNLSMLDQRASEAGLLQKAHEKDVGIIGRTPLNFGFLTENGKTMSLDFGPRDHRSLWKRPQLEAWQKGAKIFSEVIPEEPLAILALRFCLGFPEASTIIPGLITVNDVLQNVVASTREKLGSDKFEKIRQIYLENKGFFAK